MTGTTYTCRACALEHRDDLESSGALQHCEVCGNWVPAPQGALSREFVPPLSSLVRT